MKNNVVQIVSIVFGVVAAAAMQDMLPTFGGVKPPLVTMVVAFIAFRMSFAHALGIGFGAGLFLDALSGVSAFCATVSMPIVALGVYFLRESMENVPHFVAGALVTAAAAVFGEVWMAASGFAVGDAGLLVRIPAVFVLAIPVGAAFFAILPRMGRHVGLEEEERR